MSSVLVTPDKTVMVANRKVALAECEEACCGPRTVCPDCDAAGCPATFTLNFEGLTFCTIGACGGQTWSDKDFTIVAPATGADCEWEDDSAGVTLAEDGGGDDLLIECGQLLCYFSGVDPGCGNNGANLNPVANGWRILINARYGFESKKNIAWFLPIHQDCPPTDQNFRLLHRNSTDETGGLGRPFLKDYHRVYVS